MLVLLLILVLAVCAGMVWLQGLWGAAMALFNTIFAGLIATNFYRPIASQIDDLLHSFTYFWDLISFWLLFLIAFSVLRGLTDLLSKYHVQFITPVEMTGRSILAIVVAWLMVSLICFSLHLAPLPRSPFFGSFQTQAMSRDFLGMAPDQQWLKLVNHCSRGSLSPLFGWEFESPSNFVNKYRARRGNLEDLQKKTRSFRVKR